MNDYGTYSWLDFEDLLNRVTQLEAEKEALEERMRQIEKRLRV